MPATPSTASASKGRRSLPQISPHGRHLHRLAALSFLPTSSLPPRAALQRARGARGHRHSRPPPFLLAPDLHSKVSEQGSNPRTCKDCFPRLAVPPC